MQRPAWLPEPLLTLLHFTTYVAQWLCLYVFLSAGECLPIVILIGWSIFISLFVYLPTEFLSAGATQAKRATERTHSSVFPSAIAELLVEQITAAFS
jgi:hypothetical protein